MILLDSDGLAANFQEGVSRHIPWEQFKHLTQIEQSSVLRSIYVKEPNFFYNLNPIPQFQELIDFAERSGERWMICTSAGQDHPSYAKAAASKVAWFERHWSIPSDKIIVTASSEHKLAYASPRNILADDYPAIVEKFRDKGGRAILVEANRYDAKAVIAELECAINEVYLEECDNVVSI